MKQKLQKQKGRLMSSLLPQKWLMSLLTLLLFCIGGGSAWADVYEYTITKDTPVERYVGSYVFTVNGAKIYVNNNNSKEYAVGTTNGYSGIKFSQGVTYTILVPEDEQIDELWITAYSNSDDKTAKVATINDGSRSEAPEFPARNTLSSTVKPVTYYVPYYSTKRNNTTFTLSGSQCVITELRLKTSSTKATYTVSANPQSSDYHERTLPIIPAIEIRDAQTGIVIPSGSKVKEGTKVRVTAPAYAAEYRLHTWDVNGTIRYTLGNSFEYEITGNISFNPNYIRNYKVNATSNIGAAVTIKETNTGKKLDASDLIGRSTPITVTAPNLNGYTFTGWEYKTYKNDGTKLTEGTKTANPLNLNMQQSEFGLAHENKTSLITNSSFEDGTLNGWSYLSGLGDVGAKENSNSVYTCENADGDYLFNTWNQTAPSEPFYIKQTLSNLAPGTYRLSALLASDQGNIITLTANSVSYDFAMSNPKGKMQECSVQFTISQNTDVEIKASSNTWFKADKFQLFVVKEAFNVTLTAMYEQQSGDFAGSYTDVDGTGYYILYGDGENPLVKNVIDEVPFMKMSFGNGTQGVTYTGVDGMSTSTVFNGGRPGVVFKERPAGSEKLGITQFQKQIPTAGTYYKFEPEVDGLLYIHGYYASDASHQYRAWLIDATNSNIVDAKLFFGGLYENDPKYVDYEAPLGGVNGAFEVNTLDGVTVTGGHTYYLFSTWYGANEYANDIPAAGTGIDVASAAMTVFHLSSFGFKPMGNLIGTNVGFYHWSSGHSPIYKIPVEPGQTVVLKGIHRTSEKNTLDFIVEGGHAISGTIRGSESHDVTLAPNPGSSEITIDITTNGANSGTIDKILVVDAISFEEPELSLSTNASHTNPIISSIPSGYNVVWSSSDPTVATVGSDGRVSTTSIPGSIVISAVATSPDKNDQIAGCYVLNVSNMHFEDPAPVITVSPNGTSSYSQPVVDAPAYATVKYEILYDDPLTTAKNAVLTQEENDDAYTISVHGAGTVKVQASVGGIKCTYVLAVRGPHYLESSFVLRGNADSFTAPRLTDTDGVSNITYRMKVEDTTESLRSAQVNTSNGNITSIPRANRSTDGGVIVVEALSGSDVVAAYCLTVPLDLYKWNFYRENEKGDEGATDDNVVSPLKYGSLVNYTSPGAAASVEPISGDLNDKVDPIRADKVNDGSLLTHLKKRRNWKNAQDGSNVTVVDYEADFTKRGGFETKDFLSWNATDGIIFNATAWEQFHIAEKVPVIPGENYTVTAQIWSDKAVSFNAAMGNWGYTFKDANVTVSGNQTYENVTFTFNNVQAPNSFITLQPYNGDVNLKVKNVKVTHSGNNADIYGNWNYVFKTLSSTQVDNVWRMWYANEPLLAYRSAVKGDNARVIRNTAGLVFDCPSGRFGVNDNLVVKKLEGDRTRYEIYREDDRAVLVQAGGKFTLPEVPVGRYIRLQWYRHSDNSGDKFNVTNAIDLDGKKINPNDDIRFTGSAYRHGFFGATIFKVDADPDAVTPGYSDVTITIAKNGWTELYSIEILDKYDTDMKICQANVWGTDELVSGTDDDYGRDINDASWYNSNASFKPVSRLVSRINTYANGGGHVANDHPERYAPSFFISGYVNHSRTWNGWLNLTLAPEVFEGTARCTVWNSGHEENVNGLPQMIPNEHVRIGSSLHYTMPHVTGVEGTGAIKFVYRCHSGWSKGEIDAWNANPNHANQQIAYSDEKHYTLNKIESWVAVGEYSVQNYPYTWDFTKYNTSLTNAYNRHSFSSIQNPEINQENQYGYWTSDYKLQANELQGTTISESASTNHEVNDYAQRNKRFFAQGSQLTIGDNTDRKYTLLETEGLRINIPAVNDANDGAVYFNVNSNAESNLVVNGTVTIPEVNHGMYIYIRSAMKPSSVSVGSGAVFQEYGKDENATITASDPINFAPNDNGTVVALHGNDIPNNVWVYRVKNEDPNDKDSNKKYDFTFTPSAPIEGIGVTKYSKNTVQFPGINEATLMTDARNENIDFHNTGFFTKHDLKAYVARSEAEMSDSGHGENGVIGLDEIVVLPSKSKSGSDNRGLVLKKTASESGLTARPRLPLFVPACNIADDNLNNNKLIGLVEAGSLPYYNKTSDTNIYILTNQHYDWDWEKAAWVAQNVGSAVNPSNLADGWHVDTQASFYILRDGGTSRPNSAYLEVTKKKTSEVKNFYMIYGAEFDEDEATGIEAIDTEAEVAGLEGADVYTVTGIKVAKPTKKGVYVVNGKKVYVK